MIEAIENFRKHNGVHDFISWNGLQSHYCNEHCWAMARAGDIYHAPAHYLNGWREAVAMMSYSGEDGHATKGQLIYDILGTSELHRKILLECSELAYGLILHHYRWYLTVRGR